MCESRIFSTHYEIDGVACLKGREFDSITDVLRAVAYEAAKYGVNIGGTVLDEPHWFPGAQFSEIVKVKTETRREVTRQVL